MSDKKLHVYYDGNCYLCNAEIAYYKKKDVQQKINFVDIANDDFDPRVHGLEGRDIGVNLHAKLANGKIIKGADSFIAIWENVPGFSFLAKISRFRWINPLAHLGYYIFAKVRPYLPKKGHEELCPSGACSVKKI